MHYHKKRVIELAYEQAEEAGLPLWCQDEAGPYQAIPQAGENWHPEGKPTLQPHEYIRGSTAKLLTLFRPQTGEVRANGVVLATWDIRSEMELFYSINITLTLPLSSLLADDLEIGVQSEGITIISIPDDH